MARSKNAQTAMVKTSATLGKYDKATSRATKAKRDVLKPAFANSTFTAGAHTPNKPNTVMGQVHALVKAAGKKGLTGSELVTGMQKINWAALATKSNVKYTNGIPCALWCQGYANGAVRKNFARKQTPAS